MEQIQEAMSCCKRCTVAAAGRIVVVRQAGSSGSLHSELVGVDSCYHWYQENRNQLVVLDYRLSTC